MYPGEIAAATPDKPAYVMEPSGETVTYAELDADANRIARILQDAGLRPGDHVAMLVENHPMFLKLAWGAQISGLLYTAVSTSLTADEVAYIVDNCDARVLIVSARYAQVAESIRSDTPKVELRLSLGGEIEGHDSLEKRMAATSPDPPSEMREGADMLYSSGTTGKPKGVVPELDLEEVPNPPPVVALMNLLWGFDENTVYLSPAPLYHAAPLRFNMGVTRFGGTSIIVERFDAEHALELIDRHRVTHAQFVPTMFVRMLKLPEETRKRYDVSSLECVIHAAAPCPVEVKQQMMEWFGEIIHEYYGGTEGNGLCAITPEEWRQHPGSVGRSLLGTAIIVGENGEELPPNEIGTVYFADGPEFEYHKDPEKTKGAYNEKGWSTMGDVGYLDEEGYLYLTDRRAYVIVTGGVNVYPQEAENLLTMHPKVQDVAVFGVPNEEFGEEVKAVVQPREGVETGPELEQELIDYCRQSLSAIKCPRSVEFREQLPRTETGKLLKRVLRDEYWPQRAPTG